MNTRLNILIQEAALDRYFVATARKVHVLFEKYDQQDPEIVGEFFQACTTLFQKPHLQIEQNLHDIVFNWEKNGFALPPPLPFPETMAVVNNNLEFFLKCQPNFPDFAYVWIPSSENILSLICQINERIQAFDDSECTGVNDNGEVEQIWFKRPFSESLYLDLPQNYDGYWTTVFRFSSEQEANQYVQLAESGWEKLGYEPYIPNSFECFLFLLAVNNLFVKNILKAVDNEERLRVEKYILEKILMGLHPQDDDFLKTKAKPNFYLAIRQKKGS